MLIATVSCHGLRPPNHLYVILSYDNRTGVDQCLWLSLVVGRIGYLSTRFLGESIGPHSQGELVVVLKNQLDIGLSTVAFVCLFASGFGP